MRIKILVHSSKYLVFHEHAKHAPYALKLVKYYFLRNNKRPGLLGRPPCTRCCKGVAIGVARRGARRNGERTLRIPPSCSIPEKNCTVHSLARCGSLDGCGRNGGRGRRSRVIAGRCCRLRFGAGPVDVGCVRGLPGGSLLPVLVHMPSVCMATARIAAITRAIALEIGMRLCHVTIPETNTIVKRP